MRVTHDAPVLIVAGAGTTGECVHDLLSERGIATRVVTELSRFARMKGVERVVLLSGRGAPIARRAEAALHASGIPWTSVRTSWLNQNFSAGYLLDGVLAGEIALPAPASTFREPFTDAHDIADVVVAALSYEHHANRTYEVTGPRALTFSEAVDEIAAGLGRPIRYVQIAPEDFVISMRAYVAEDVVQLLHEFFTIARRDTPVAEGVEQVLGHPARDFSHYVRDTVAAGTWSI
jgi:uncharacterized protein YbjT (DUF2867 family)